MKNHRSVHGKFATNVPQCGAYKATTKVNRPVERSPSHIRMLLSSGVKPTRTIAVAMNLPPHDRLFHTAVWLFLLVQVNRWYVWSDTPGAL